MSQLHEALFGVDHGPGADAPLERTLEHPVRVVVADDAHLVREAFALALLQSPDIDVVGQAADGDTALRLVAEWDPAVVVLDLAMPVAGGLPLLIVLRERHPHVRAIVVTADDDRSALLDAIGEGAAGFLSKRGTCGKALCEAVLIVNSGGSVVTPSLAVHLLDEYATIANGGEPSGGPLLSEGEREVVRLVGRGLTDHQLSLGLGVSPRTVQNRLAALREKTGIRSRADLATWAAGRMGASSIS
jgi:DNA-binding NarL/FixJ family response regulator